MSEHTGFTFFHGQGRFLARWKWGSTTKYTRTLDLRVKQIESDTYTNGFPVEADLDEKPVIAALASAARGGSTWVKLILPATSGYILRNDFLRWRMIASEGVTSVQSFVKPREHIQAINDDKIEMTDALDSVVGAIFVNSTSGDYEAVMEALDEEVANRLGYPWVVTSALEQNRLVIISHRHPDVMANYLGSCAAAGISVTLVDSRNGFISQEKRFGAVEDCVEVDMTRDEGLTTRIVEALATRGPFDGMVTFTDTYMLYTAEVATKMGLYTLPLNLVKTCLDKHATRKYFKDAKPALRISSKADLQAKMPSEDFTYPLIVKPCTAWGSQGVYKVTNEEELFAAVEKAQKSATTSDLIVDEYCDGPEVDANFVLQDGKVLYFEMVDGFPCTAEIENNGQSGDFIETDQLWPSKHPAVEQDLARTKLHRLLLDMGITDGVFHVEARFRDAALRYEIQDNILDLYAPKLAPTQSASLFLLEVNQRPPGHGGSWGTAMSYGIDYPLLHMLCALRQSERYAAAAHGFASGAIRHVDSVFVNSHVNGVYVGGDLMEELKTSRPDLANYVQYSNTYYDPGEEIADSPARRVLEISRELREAVVVRVEPFKR